MRRPGRVLGAALLAACSPPAQDQVVEHCAGPDAPPGTRVLVFSRTVGFRHASIPAGVAALGTLGERHGFVVEHTEDAARFTDDELARFGAVVFLNTTGDVLDSAHQAAFERFVRAGRGFVGVHSATDTEYEWAWYGELVGAYFKSHPAVQPATVHLQVVTHPATRCLASPWTRTDEWYDFRALPAAGVSVLATVDESSYQGATMGAVHPVSWHHAFEGGRAWYTAMGHTTESYAEPAFLDHLAGGILWALGSSP